MRNSQCVIVGAGPGGMMLALLLARAGIHVEVLEAQHDFDRDFRGDTVHASTLALLDLMGLADRLLAMPHARIERMQIHSEGRTIQVADFSRLPGKFGYIAIMPQSQFLEFLHDEATRFDNYHMHFGTPINALAGTESELPGVVSKASGHEKIFRAPVIVAADGRYSRMRKLTGAIAHPRTPLMDVCWLRVPREPEDALNGTSGFFVHRGRMVVALERPDSWQLGYVFAKGDYQQVKDEGITAFRAGLLRTAPWLGQRVQKIESFDQVHLLNIQSDCLEDWVCQGVLHIGDAAHVMSPIGGVGINLAIADAVASANAIVPALLGGTPIEPALRQVQQQRDLITRVIQTAQRLVQQNFIASAIKDQPFQLPLPARAVLSTPYLRNLPPLLFGRGIKPPRPDVFV